MSSLIHKSVAATWCIIGACVVALTAKDITKVGVGELLESPSLLGGVALLSLIAMACLVLGAALWRSLSIARPLGVFISGLFSLGVAAYGAANLYVALKANLLASFVAVAAAILGLALCVLTFRIARRIGSRGLQDTLPSTQQT